MRQEFDDRPRGRPDGGIGLIDDDESLTQVAKHSLTCPQHEHELHVAPCRQRDEKDPNKRQALGPPGITNQVSGGRGIHQRRDYPPSEPDAREIATQLGALLFRQGPLVEMQYATLRFDGPHVLGGKAGVIRRSHRTTSGCNDP